MSVTKQFLTLKLSEIKPYPNNPRINDEAVADVVASIEQCENLDPIEIDEKNVILSGHTRLKALKRLKYKETDVIKITGLNEQQKRKYRLLANKTGERALWDNEKLDFELEGLDFGGFDFGFEFGNSGDWTAGNDAAESNDEYERKKREFEQKMQNGEISEEDEEYQEFVKKFELKKTTDDCYTPPVVYEAVEKWVEDEYKVDRVNFVRPFYPGGDYKKENYKDGAIVVDNPPFSILSEILAFYAENNIKFFLFAPTLTLFSSSSSSSSAIPVGVSITYENGANVDTSFLTNLEDENIRVRTAPTLYTAVNDANKLNLKDMRRELPKYEYNNYIITSTRCGQFSKYGIDFVVTKSESKHIRQLDAQKEAGKTIFGSGYLVSERIKAEKEKAEEEKAEKEKAEKWELSEREKEIVKKLGGVCE